jgi:hypothetical protein
VLVSGRRLFRHLAIAIATLGTAAVVAGGILPSSLGAASRAPTRADPVRVVVPRVVGLEPGDAMLRLCQVGLVPVNGATVWYDPSPATSLRVARLAQLAQLAGPTLEGRRRARGLAARIDELLPSHVVSTNPPAGRLVPRGSRIRLRVAAPRGRAEVSIVTC